MKYFLRSDDFISRLLFTRYAGNFKYPNDNGKRYIRLLTRQDLIKLTEIPPIRIWWQRLSLVLSTYFLLVVAFLSRNIEFDQSLEYIYMWDITIGWFLIKVLRILIRACYILFSWYETFVLFMQITKIDFVLINILYFVLINSE